MICPKTTKVWRELNLDLRKLQDGGEIYPSDRVVYLEILEQKLRDALNADVRICEVALKKMHALLLHIAIEMLPWVATVVGIGNQARVERMEFLIEEIRETLDWYGDFISPSPINRGSQTKSEKESGK